MRAVEFRTSVKDGMIQVPEELRSKVRGHVRVILLTEDTEDTQPNIIDHLLEHPLKIDNFVPLSRNEIYDRR